MLRSKESQGHTQWLFRGCTDPVLPAGLTLKVVPFWCRICIVKVLLVKVETWFWSQIYPDAPDEPGLTTLLGLSPSSVNEGLFGNQCFSQQKCYWHLGLIGSSCVGVVHYCPGGHICRNSPCPPQVALNTVTTSNHTPISQYVAQGDSTTQLRTINGSLLEEPCGLSVP